MKDIAIYGAGGFGKEIACLIEKINNSNKIWNFIGYFDDGLDIGVDVSYGKIIGGIHELNEYNKPLSLVIAIASTVTLSRIHSLIENKNINFPNLISPDLIFLDKKSTELGIGNIFCSGCLISCNVKIGNFNIFNGFIPIGHDTIIGNYNSFMPSVKISGEVKIGDCNFFGVNSVLLQKIKIGNYVRLAASSVLIKNPKDNNLYLGNPAIKTNI